MCAWVCVYVCVYIIEQNNIASWDLILEFLFLFLFFPLRSLSSVLPKIILYVVKIFSQYSEPLVEMYSIVSLALGYDLTESTFQQKIS